MVEHVVERITDYRYECLVCGQAGSEQWAILHQFPSERNVIGAEGTP